VLSNGKRCPNEALPGSRYCGLPAHQELALKDTEDDVEPIVAEADPELEAEADLAPPEAESIGPESLDGVEEGIIEASDSLLAADGHELAEPDEVPAGIPVETMASAEDVEEQPPAA
jgi:transcription termination/antitermination protein NusA